jgi:cation diffusion facilitator family transporter
MDKKSAATVAVYGGIFIFLLKLASYVMSGSVALLSDALESIVNIIASGLMLYSVLVSEKPPDEEHKYGHEKIENITCLIEGMFIITAALFIIHSALEKISAPMALSQIESAIGVNLLATAFNGGLSWMLMKTAEDKGSMALEGDAKHLLSDVITSLGVALGLWIAQITGWAVADPVIAIIVALLIIRMGVTMVVKSGRDLMDERCPKTEKKIMEILEDHRYMFINFHDVNTRKSGSRVFAELHLSVDGSLSVQEAHDLTDHLEEDLFEELPHLGVTIHIEPPDARA